MRLLSDQERNELLPAEFAALDSPIPTQIVSSDEFAPIAQTPTQREVEARLKTLADELAHRQGMTRRQFFRTAAGMAAAFVAMNDVYGPLFGVSRAEAATPELADERANQLGGQFVFDGHTHFLREDTQIQTFVRMREAVGKAGWNPELVGKPQTIEDLKFDNYMKEIFFDSDTKIAIISSAPSDIPADWFLTNPMTAKARARVNDLLGARRMLSHAIFTPGQPGWLDEVERAIAEDEPDSLKGYTIGDNTHKDLSRYPWRMDDEKLVYPFYEKAWKAGINNICVHKGLFPPSVEKQYPHLRAFCDVRDVGQAAKDWPMLNFIIYHAAYRFPGGGTPEEALAQFEQTGRVEWVSGSGRDPGEVRSHQRVWRPRAGVCHHHRGPAAAGRGHPRHPGERSRGEERGMGLGCGVDRCAAVADRGIAAARDSRRHAAEVRLRAARLGHRTGEERHLRREFRAPVRHRADDVRERRRPSGGVEAGYVNAGGVRSNLRYGYVTPADIRSLSPWERVG